MNLIKYFIKRVKNFTLTFKKKKTSIYSVVKLFLKLKRYIRFNLITFSFLKDSIFRLKYITKFKKKKHYTDLTKEFLIDPNFLFLVYLQSKNKFISTKILLNRELFNYLNIRIFVNIASKIHKNTYALKSFSITEIKTVVNSKWFLSREMENRLIQASLYTLISQIYEYETFFCVKISQTGNSGYSIHTILKKIKTSWKNICWFVKFKFESIFAKINCNILINLLSKKIQDKILLNLVSKIFKFNVSLTSNFFSEKTIKTWKNNLLISFLCNVYLNEFDTFLINRIQKLYTVGKQLIKNYKYLKKFDVNKFELVLKNELKNNDKKIKRRQLFNKGVKPYLHDKNYIRVKYARCYNEFLIGVHGPKFIIYKIKTEVQNWLKMNLHLAVQTSSPIHGIGNKVKFLGFYLYSVPFYQIHSLNSKSIEKFRRTRKKIVLLKLLAVNKLNKKLRTRLTKNMKKISLSKNNRFNFITQELSHILLGLIKKIDSKNSYRSILRSLEKKISTIVLNNTNKRIIKLLKNLVYLNSFYCAKKKLTPKTVKSKSINSNRSINSIIKCFNTLLQKNGFVFCSFKKLNFSKSFDLYLTNKKIKLINYSSNVILPKYFKTKLKKKRKKFYLIYNYRILNDFFWAEINSRNFNYSSDFLSKIVSQNIEFKTLKSDFNFLDWSSVFLKTNWKKVVQDLKIKKFLNKKGRPSSVSYLLILTVSELIKYFSNVFYKYIFYYKCADNFNKVKSRFFWYFKFSLISTIKTKFKLKGLFYVFKKYGKTIHCIDRKNNKVCFVKWNDIKGIKKGFLDKI